MTFHSDHLERDHPCGGFLSSFRTVRHSHYLDPSHIDSQLCTGHVFYEQQLNPGALCGSGDHPVDDMSWTWLR